MVDALLDTSILIDLLRNYSTATQWKNTNSHLTFGLSSVVRMEVLRGSPNRRRVQQALRFLNQFTLIPILQVDLDWAEQQFAIYYFSHNVGVLDCIIAAPCHRLNLPLYTRNLKHFTPILGTLVQSPY
jgi:predicted nucleic acid-binding protein